MKRHLLAATALTGFFSITLINPAFATCDNNTPTTGQTVSCTTSGGTDTTGVGGASQTGVTVNVGTSAIVHPGVGGTDAVVIGNGSVIVGSSAQLISDSGQGIHANSSAGLTTVTMGGGSTVNGGDYGMLFDGAADITIDGTLIGGNGTAIRTNAISSATRSIVRINNTASITGNIIAGAASADELHYVDSGTTTFHTDDIGTVYQNFEKFYKDGSGTTTLDGSTVEDWNITAGTLKSAYNLIGDANVSTGAILQLTGNGNYTHNITGTGNVLINGATIRFSGTNDFTGTLTVNSASTLQVDTAAAMSGASSVTVDFSTFKFGGAFSTDRNFIVGASAATFDTNGFDSTITGAVSGSGEFVKGGTGTLTLSGANTLSGKVNIVNGTLLVSASNNLGDGSGTNSIAMSGGTLKYGASFDTARNFDFISPAIIDTNGFDSTLSGVLSNTGSLTKNGLGTLTLTNTNTYSGATSVNAGTLIVNGSIGNSNVLVASGATLGGHGTVKDLVANGTISPGSFGTLNATGVTAFNNGSTYRVNIDNTGQTDLIHGTGGIAISAGSSVFVNAVGGTYSPTTNYTILDGSTVTGTFTNVSTNLAFLTPTLSYTTNSVSLQMARNGTEFADVAADTSQRQTALAVAQLGAGNDAFDAFTGLTAEQARAALDTLSGEHNAGITSSMTQSTQVVRNIVSNRVASLTHQGGEGDLAALSPSQTDYQTGMAAGESYERMAQGGVWLEGIGSFGHSDASGSSAEQDRHSYGGLAGIDIPLFDEGYFGIFAGYEQGQIRTDSENASSDLNNYHAGLYASLPITDGMTFSFGGTGTYHDINTERHVTFPGFSATPEGDTNGYTMSGFAELSQAFLTEEMAIEPFLNVSYTRSHMDGYTETKGGTANLVVGSSSQTTPATTLGVRLGKSLETTDGNDVHLTGSLGWQHNFGGLDSDTQMRFAAGTLTFDTYGPALERDAGVIGVGMDGMISDGLEAYLGYDGSISKETQDHGFKAGLKWDF